MMLIGSSILLFTGVLLKLQHNPHNEFLLIPGLIFSLVATAAAIKDLFSATVDNNVRVIWLMSFFLVPIATGIYFIKRLIEEKNLNISHLK